MDVDKFIKVAALLQQLKDDERIEDFGIHPINRTYELNSNYKPCSSVVMEVYIYPKLEPLEIELFNEFGFNVRNSEWDDDVHFASMEIQS